MPDVKNVVEHADMIVNGYAFTAMENGWVRVLNLNSPQSAFVLDANGELVETSADDIEARIVRDYYLNNKEFMGGSHA